MCFAKPQALLTKARTHIRMRARSRKPRRPRKLVAVLWYHVAMRRLCLRRPMQRSMRLRRA